MDVIFVPFDSSWERSEFRVLVMARALRLADRLNSWIQCSTSSLAQSRRVLHSLAGARAPQGQEHTECSAPVGPRGIFFSMVQQQAPGSGIWSSEIGSPEIPDAFVGSIELMAVPKRKVTPSRKGKRNGPKFLKSAPVVAKCIVCGRVKLPHFYCCDGQVKG